VILPLYNSLAPLTLNRLAPALDPDAQAYIEAVELEDGEALEAGVRTAINDFVTGCKSDGIWSAIKAACILAGARTLDGALVPLVGSAPTNFNFVSGDYDRETGLKGNQSTKYLSSGRNANADPQDDHHLSVFYSEAEVFVSGGKLTIGAGGASNGATHFGRSGVSPGNMFVRNRSFTVTNTGILGDVNNIFSGMSRSSSSEFIFRYGSSVTISRASQTPINQTINVFQSANLLYSGARLSFYSIGESLDLALLDTRVSTLMTDLSAAI
jgi:hypothetical protein